MTRHGLFAILALTGLVLTTPDPTFARPGFRPAFTPRPFRIVPTGRLHFSGAPHIHGTAMTPKPAAHIVRKPLVHTAAAGAAPFRRHHRFYGSLYPVTYGADSSYYGMPYDPSDVPAYPPVAEADDTAAPVLAMPQRYPVANAERGCRAQHVLVPNASRAGESEITIVRC